MEGGFRNLITVLIMVTVLISGSLLFLSGFLTSNGASLPANVNSTLTSQAASLNTLSTTISNQINSSSGNAQGLLGGGQSPNVLSSIAATFAVFGGVVVALFGFIVTLPSQFISFFGIFVNPTLDPFASVLGIFLGVMLAMISLTILWAIIRAITKVDV